MTITPSTASPELLLALETSGDICSAAVFRGGRFLAEEAFRHEMHLSERLIGRVEALLSGVGAAIQDVDMFAAGIGPGSFTGTRIGVMTLKTLAYVQGKPIYAVNGLEAMAAEYGGLGDLVVTPVLPCRSGAVYACPFRVDGEVPIALAEPAALTFAELGRLVLGLRLSGPSSAATVTGVVCLQQGAASSASTVTGAASSAPTSELSEAAQGTEAKTLLFCGPAARRYEGELREAMAARAEAIAFGAVSFPRASTIGELALRRAASGMEPPPALEVAPLYISPPPITLPKQPIPIQRE